MTPDLGHSEIYKNVFFLNNRYDWVTLQNDHSWNLGNESSPVKTENDPCPAAWRVPTYAELSELYKNRSAWTSEDDKSGYWFSGASSYTDEVPQVFFPAASYRNPAGNADFRGGNGFYWSSSPNYSSACYLGFGNGIANMDGSGRANGFSVRCVQVPTKSLSFSEE